MLGSQDSFLAGWRFWMVGVLALLLVVSGCAKDPRQASIEAWADEFAAARQKWAASPRAVAVLEDGQITDQEVEELRAWLEQCIIDAGWPGTSVDTRRGLEVPNPPSMTKEDDVRLSADVSRCEDEVGWPSVQSLYNSVRTNPMNVDVNVLMAECLVRHGLVAEPFTAKEYEQADKALFERLNSGESEDLDLGDVIPVLIADKEQARAIFHACNEEPLK